MLKIKVILIFLFISSITFGQTPIDYIRTNEYDRLHLTLDDFKKISSSIQYYSREIILDSNKVNEVSILKCDFSRKEKALTLSTFNQINEVDIDEDTYTDLILFYSRNNNPISEVTLFLNNSYRKLTVKGTDEKKVEALYRDIDNQLRTKQSFLSWINLGITLSMLFMILFIISIIILLESGRYVFSNGRNRRSILLFIITGLFSLISIFFFFSSLRINDLFPNFILTSDNSTWIDKNTNFIGFIGFIISIITIFYNVGKWILKEKK